MCGGICPGGNILHPIEQPVRRCGDWNFARIYATIILVVTCLNAVRFAIIFDGTETLGAALFMKLGIMPAAFLNIVLQTSYYFASHMGCLRRVFRQVDLSMVDLQLYQKYDRRTKLVVVVVWILLAWNVFHYFHQQEYPGNSVGVWKSKR